MEKFNCDTFCERTTELFGDKGQIELSTAIGISQGMISGIKQKKLKSPGADIVCKIANYFNVSTDYLLGLSNEIGVGEKHLKAKQRVERELKELKEKYKRLTNFYFDKANQGKLNEAECYLMTEQRLAMFKYQEILEARLAIWREIE